MNTYQPDTLIQLTTTFFMADGVTPINPTAVFLFVRTPDGIVTSYTGGDFAHPSTGNYSYDLVTNQFGPWIYKWQGTGAVEITSPDVYFFVEQSVVFNP